MTRADRQEAAALLRRVLAAVDGGDHEGRDVAGLLEPGKVQPPGTDNPGPMTVVWAARKVATSSASVEQPTA